MTPMEQRTLVDVRRRVRADMHCHTRASSAPATAALGMIGVPECYSEPEAVYELARKRGMDLVAVTDHDTIAGAMELVERGFENLIVGEEVTVHFPEDRCRLHVLVWGLSASQHEQIGRHKLRDDVYDFARWLREQNLAHALAHPLYVQNGRFNRWHLDRCALLFKGFETLNGAHSGSHRAALDVYLREWLKPGKVRLLIERTGLEPVWPCVWEKATTGGSDDHALLNVGRTWTEVPLDFEERAREPEEFLRRVMSGRASPGGVAGNSAGLAHQLASVGAHFAARAWVPGLRPARRMLAGKLLRFAGISVERPGKLALAWDTARRRVAEWTGRARPEFPLLSALAAVFGPVLERHAEISRAVADPSRGVAVGEHEAMSAFFDDLHASLHEAMASGAWRAATSRDRDRILDHVFSYAVLELSQVPYWFSLFHQNKERPFAERLEHEASGGARERAMRVSLFTDTLGDVNGVCRFIQNVAEMAERTGRDLEVITSTRLPVPARSNIFNFRPLVAGAIPRYENLEMVLPPLTRILRHLDRHQPDVIHISTPGPMGLIGYIAARMLRVPVLGVYHTDFPAYIDQLFDDHAMTWTTRQYMTWFYRPFKAIFTRSADYADRLVALGLPRERMTALVPGVDTSVFDRRFRDDSIWSRYPGAMGGDGVVRVLYVGRVSVEKNLPLLNTVWKRTAERLRALGAPAQLVVVGDGPYRETMERELSGTGALFLGFRHGEELSALYASSDVFVFPSVTDTLGQVVMESQASGLPVLVSDVGGPKEVVEDGRTGFVLAADRPDAWAERLVSLVTDGGARRAMGEAAYESMRAMSIERSFEHFWRVHEEAWREHRFGGRTGVSTAAAGEPGAAIPGHAGEAQADLATADAR